MTIGDNDQQTLLALQAARTEHKELAELLDFYCELYELQFDAKADLPEPEMWDESASRWRLERGIPQLTFAQLGLEPASFARLVQQVGAVLLRHNPTWQSDWQEWTAQELKAKAQEVFETWDTLTAPKAAPAGGGDALAMQVQPMALAVGLALAPYLQRASEAILPHLDLALWPRGYCPLCGGRPNLALLEQERGARLLMCSRCASLWPYARVGCPFCEGKEKQNYYLSDDGVYRLYVCPECNRYLKTVDLREVHRPVHPLVERLVTVGLDLAARQEGFEG